MAMTPSERPLLDTNYALNRLRGDKDFLRELYTMYLEDGAEKLTQFNTALNNNDQDVMVKSVHSLKSIASTVGALPLSELCYTIEHAARNGEMNIVRQKHPLLMDMSRQVDELVHKALQII
jgi:HPt (histidine-containing phosphotransfer) domain-containing protein